MVELQVWGLAITLSKEHVEKRLHEVVTTVAKWLSQADRYEAAGELYEDINAMKDVIPLYPIFPNQQISRFRSQYTIELKFKNAEWETVIREIFGHSRVVICL